MFIDLSIDVCRYDEGCEVWSRRAGQCRVPPAPPSPLVVSTLHMVQPAQLYTLHSGHTATAAQTAHSTGQCLYLAPGRHRAAVALNYIAHRKLNHLTKK